MPLDLAKLAPLLREMGGVLVDPRPAETAAVEEGLAALHRWANRLDDIWVRLGNQTTSWLCAEPCEPLDARHPLPECPARLTVLGSDGSQIPPDPHDAVLCYVLNVGLVAVSYGPGAGARLSSVPKLAYTEEELFVPIGGQRLLVEGDNLAVRRGALELQELAALAAREAEAGRWPLVALRDGTLIEWTLQRGQDEAAREALYEPFVAALDELRERGVPVASYVSRPRSPYVVNMLRVACCEQSEADCRRLCNLAHVDRTPGVPLCARLRGLTDRQLFEALPLREGERSALFKRAGKHSWRQVEAAASVHFFYLHVGAEIARIEVPDWVAADPALLDLVHAAMVDQCRRGDGYPSVLTEAHEQAVLRPPDREQFRYLLDHELARLGYQPSASAKAQSKRRRAL